MFDLNALSDAMTRAGASLQDAMQRGDIGRADRTRNHLARLNHIAQERVERANAQTAKIPGTDNGSPTGMLGLDSGLPPEPGLQNPSQPSMPKQANSMFPQDIIAGAGKGFSQNMANMPQPPKPQQSNTAFSFYGQDSDYNGPTKVTGTRPGSTDPLEWTKRFDIPHEQVMKLPEEVGKRMRATDIPKSLTPMGPLIELGQGVKAAGELIQGSPKAQQFASDVVSDQPLDVTVKNLFKTDADAEKKAGSLENAAAMKQALQPDVTTENEHTQYADQTVGPTKTANAPPNPHADFDPAKMRMAVEQWAQESGDVSEFAGKMEEQAPGLLNSPTDLLTLLFFGAKGLFHQYDQRQTNYRQGRELNAQRQNALMRHNVVDTSKMAELGLKQRGQDLDEKKFAYNLRKDQEEKEAGDVLGAIKSEESRRHDISFSPTAILGKDIVAESVNVATKNVQEFQKQLKRIRDKYSLYNTK